MIHCYLRADAYYILGPNIEVYSTLKNPEKDEIRAVYWAFLVMLSDPDLMIQKDNITINNNSRFIDDMSGLTKTLDAWCTEGRKTCLQMTGTLRGIVLFNKLETTDLDTKIEVGRSQMIDPEAKRQAAKNIQARWSEKHKTRISRLKNAFFEGESQ